MWKRRWRRRRWMVKAVEEVDDGEAGGAGGEWWRRS